MPFKIGRWEYALQVCNFRSVQFICIYTPPKVYINIVSLTLNDVSPGPNTDAWNTGVFSQASRHRTKIAWPCETQNTSQVPAGHLTPPWLLSAGRVERGGATFPMRPTHLIQCSLSDTCDRTPSGLHVLKSIHLSAQKTCSVTSPHLPESKPKAQEGIRYFEIWVEQAGEIESLLQQVEEQVLGHFLNQQLEQVKP